MEDSPTRSLCSRDDLIDKHSEVRIKIPFPLFPHKSWDGSAQKVLDVHFKPFEDFDFTALYRPIPAMQVKQQQHHKLTFLWCHWLRVKVSQRIANTGKLRISLALVPDVSVLFCQSDEIGKSSRFGVFAIAGSRKSQAGDYSNSREKVKRMITHPRYEAGHIAPIIP